MTPDEMRNRTKSEKCQFCYGDVEHPTEDEEWSLFLELLSHFNGIKPTPLTEEEKRKRHDL